MNDLIRLNGELGHWLFEIEGVVITALLGAGWHSLWQKRHERIIHHPNNLEDRVLILEAQAGIVSREVMSEENAIVYNLDDYREKNNR